MENRLGNRYPLLLVLVFSIAAFTACGSSVPSHDQEVYEYMFITGKTISITEGPSDLSQELEQAVTSLMESHLFDFNLVYARSPYSEMRYQLVESNHYISFDRYGFYFQPEMGFSQTANVGDRSASLEVIPDHEGSISHGGGYTTLVLNKGFEYGGLKGYEITLTGRFVTAEAQELINDLIRVRWYRTRADDSVEIEWELTATPYDEYYENSVEPEVQPFTLKFKQALFCESWPDLSSIELG